MGIKSVVLIVGNIAELVICSSCKGNEWVGPLVVHTGRDILFTTSCEGSVACGTWSSMVVLPVVRLILCRFFSCEKNLHSRS